MEALILDHRVFGDAGGRTRTHAHTRTLTRALARARWNKVRAVANCYTGARSETSILRVVKSLYEIHMVALKDKMIARALTRL